MEDQLTTDARGAGPKLPQLLVSKPLRQQVFEYVRAEGTAARSDVTRALRISPGSATTLTADLIGAGVLREIESPLRESGRGRPPVALEVVSEANHVVGVKLSDEKHTAVLVDFAGNIVADAALTVSIGQTPIAQRLTEIQSLLDCLLEKAVMERAQIKFIGIGLAGLFDHDAGICTWSPLITERNQPIKQLCSDHVGIPVQVDNDTNVLTLAELWFGVGRTMSDFVVVTIENGVGMGVVLGNRLYRGMRGMGLELGHTKVELDGALCRCGRRGCLEAYLADYALTREAATALNMVADDSASNTAILGTLYSRAKAGDVAAQNIFRRAGRFLALGLSNVIQLFDPELIILSGERMQFDYLYANEVMSEMQSFALSEDRAPTRVQVHGWGDLIWARGAAALALSSLTDQLLGTDSWGK